MNNQEYCNYISKLSIKALLYEVAVTPKPGLVDRNNSGAHKDMDFFTFIDSSLTLGDYFNKCTKAGISFSGDDYSNLLKDIRPIGIQAEKDMYLATYGVNTHKGLIFSIGIIAAAAGLHFNRFKTIYIASKEISEMVKVISKDITLELMDIENKENLTYGEKLYYKYGVKGIRGEVEEGFETVLKYSLPVLEDLLRGSKHINDILVQVLLHLIANTEDSNILGRHDKKTLIHVKEMATIALAKGGYFNPEGKEYIEKMDKYFIANNISPGGSADLIAVTIMLYFIENGDRFQKNIIGDK